MKGPQRSWNVLKDSECIVKVMKGMKHSGSLLSSLKVLKGLESSWMVLKGPERYWKVLKGLAMVLKILIFSKGNVRVWNILEGLETTWKFLNDLERSWVVFKGLNGPERFQKVLKGCHRSPKASKAQIGSYWFRKVFQVLERSWIALRRTSNELKHVKRNKENLTPHKVL